MKPKETLEEMVTRIKAENKANKKRIEQLEVKNAIYEETLEFYAETRGGQKARQALNGEHND